MTRLAISLPDDLHRRLRLLAAQRGTSMASIVREALEEKTQQSRPRLSILGLGDSGHADTSELAGEVRPKPRSLGLGASGYSDTAERAEELRELWGAPTSGSRGAVSHNRGPRATMD
jgi:plasmid stability protein